MKNSMKTFSEISRGGFKAKKLWPFFSEFGYPHLHQIESLSGKKQQFFFFWSESRRNGHWEALPSVRQSMADWDDRLPDGGNSFNSSPRSGTDGPFLQGSYTEKKRSSLSFQFFFIFF